MQRFWGVAALAAVVVATWTAQGFGILGREQLLIGSVTVVAAGLPDFFNSFLISPFGIRPILDQLAQGKGGVNNNIGLGPDNLFVHMTGMSDLGWQGVKNAGAQVSLAVPIEMNMRHGMPPILKMQSLGMEPSL